MRTLLSKLGWIDAVFLAVRLSTHIENSAFNGSHVALSQHLLSFLLVVIDFIVTYDKIYIIIVHDKKSHLTKPSSDLS